MTILDRGVTAKNKEDNAKTRQTSLENANRKPRSRTGHSVRDRIPGHSRSGQVSPTVSGNYSYWADPAIAHRSPEPHFNQEIPHRQMQHEDLNIRGHIKPRGLSKSSVVTATNTEAQSGMTEPVTLQSACPLPVPPALSPIDLPSSSCSVKNTGRLIKKNSEKKISHKKKQRRSMPHHQSGKVVKCQVKTNAQIHRAKVSHQKPPESVLATAETPPSVSHSFISPTLLNTNSNFHEGNEASNRYGQYSNQSPEFLRGGALACPDQYASLTKRPQCSRNSPNILNAEIRTQDHDNFEKDLTEETSEAKHNSDDEYDQGRLQRLNCGVDFQNLEREFEEKLKKIRGFVIKPMGEDGACLFRAVADQVYGDQNMHDEVRKNCMNYMTKNSDYYSNYVTEDFKAYIDRKRELHTFGNHLEMQAMAELYNRPFEVYQYGTEPINTFQTSHPSANPPIRVSYCQNSHYNSVIDPYVATVGVGLGLPSFHPGLVDKNMLNAAVKASCEVWEQQMLNDKVQATDWESTDDVIMEQVARESYMEYIEQKTTEIQEEKPEVSEGKKSPALNTSTSEQCSAMTPPKVVKEFPKKTNHVSNSGMSDWVEEGNEWEVISQVLGDSQQEYMDALKHQATHSKATCSKYT